MTKRKTKFRQKSNLLQKGPLSPQSIPTMSVEEKNTTAVVAAVLPVKSLSVTVASTSIAANSMSLRSNSPPSVSIKAVQTSEWIQVKLKYVKKKGVEASASSSKLGEDTICIDIGLEKLQGDQSHSEGKSLGSDSSDVSAFEEVDVDESQFLKLFSQRQIFLLNVYKYFLLECARF